MPTERPFVDFYTELDISPVRQDVSDLQRHYRRRESLYRFLGIPRGAVRGGSVIEFGPGSGYNALYTAHLGPARYVLVDANARGIEEMRTLFAEHGIADVEIVDALIEEFRTDERFDVVLAEGLIVFQRDPAAFARRIASFTAPGGILVVTCSDAASVMGENARRLIAARIAPAGLPLERRMEILRAAFAPHLATLRGMSRSVDDWILDNIIQPLAGRKLFSIGDAIAALGDGFDVYGSSPRFLTDWRWYKQVVDGDREFNARALDAYRRSVLNLLDYRITAEPQPAETGAQLLASCEEIYELMHAVERGESAWPAVLAALDRLVALTGGHPAAASLTALRNFLGSSEPDLGTLEAFAPYFGRGMQYLSLIRRDA